MREQRLAIQKLISLPERMAEYFARLDCYPRAEWFGTCDPAGRPLGSGGGTAHLLIEAWRAMASGQRFAAWLRESRKLVIHGGGQSRRLPAYAPVSKLFIPVPVFRWARGQRLDQKLLDLQCPEYERVLAHAPRDYAVMITSGDVLPRLGKELPPLPRVDVLGLGMWVNPEVAKDFGVFFSQQNFESSSRSFICYCGACWASSHNDNIVVHVSSIHEICHFL